MKNKVVEILLSNKSYVHNSALRYLNKEEQLSYNWFPDKPRIIIEYDRSDYLVAEYYISMWDKVHLQGKYDQCIQIT